VREIKRMRKGSAQLRGKKGCRNSHELAACLWEGEAADN